MKLKILYNTLPSTSKISNVTVPKIETTQKTVRTSMILSTSRTYYYHNTNSQNEVKYHSKDGGSLQIFSHYISFFDTTHTTFRIITLVNYVFCYPV